MAPRVDPVRSDAALPARTGVVVVGGGIIGASTALFLARKGVPVLLCEKGGIAAEQSSRNWGWCRKMGRDPRELPLAIESLRLWREMDALTGADTGWRQSGILYLSRTQAELAEREAWLAAARPFQLDSRLVTGAEAAALLPGLAGDWVGGLYTPRAGRAEPGDQERVVRLGREQGGRAGRGRHARDADVVLDQHGNALERAARAVRRAGRVAGRGSSRARRPT